MSNKQLVKSKLGFGCSSLMGKLSEKESLYLLDCAYDSGIRHFDVARSYGYGEAEGVLGKFLSNKRDDVSIATKVGLAPIVKHSALRSVLGIATKVGRHFTGAHRTFRRFAPRMRHQVELSNETITSSFQTSTKELRTEHIDILLLHECSVGDLNPDVLDTLQRLKQEGRIGSYGIGTSLENTISVLNSFQDAFSIVQFEDNPKVKSMRNLPIGDDQLAITHRTISTVQNLVQDALSAANLNSDLADKLEFDPRDRQALALSLLSYALAENPEGAVLFSSRSIDSIKMSAQLLNNECEQSRQQSDALVELAAWASTTLSVC